MLGRAVTCAIIGVVVMAGPVLAGPQAGWGADKPKKGVRGYLYATSYGTQTGNDAVSSWFGLCAQDCAYHLDIAGNDWFREWVQVGIRQGAWQGTGESQTQARSHYEHVNPCNEYFGQTLDSGPPSLPYFYLVKYDGEGLKLHECDDAVGHDYYGYEFIFKKGSATSNPFFTGVMSSNDGRADAVTEIHDTPTMNNRYFGCANAGQNCDDPDYGFEVLANGSWNLCCATPYLWDPDSGPPHLHTYNNAWSFKTCPNLC
jgi:hypothetical protein